MRTRMRSPAPLPETVMCPTGNVQLVREPCPTLLTGADGDGDARWVIQDGTGRGVGVPQRTHAEAVREMGRIALRGAVLPLRLIAPDGRPTHDQLG